MARARPLTRAASAGLLAAALVGTGAPAAGQAPDAAPARVYGLELEQGTSHDRLLVFTRGSVEARLEEVDATHVALVAPGAVLDEPPPPAVLPEVAGAVVRATAREVATPDGPGVRIDIEHAPGARAELARRGGILAVEVLRAPERRGARFALHFEDAELTDVVTAVAEATGERFVFDERLRGRVTIGVFDRIGREEMLEVLFAALRVRGFVAMPSPGGAWTVVSITGSAARAPFRPGPLRGESETPVVTLLRLAAAAPEDVARALAPWLSHENVAVPMPRLGGVLVAGPERKLREWLALARALDAAAERELVVVRLRHRSAEEVARLVHERMQSRSGPPSTLRVWADARTASLILQGTAPEMARARQLIERVDRALAGEGALRAYPVRHADPEALEAVLRGAVEGVPAPSAAGAGAPAVRAAAALAHEPVVLALHRPTRRLLVRAAPRGQALVAKLLDALDRPRPQVSVEATLLEVRTSDTLRLGLDAFVPLTSPDAPDDWIASVLSNPSGGGLLQPGASQGVAGAARITREPLVIPVLDALGDPVLDPAGNPVTVIVPRESAVVTADGRSVAARALMQPHLVVGSGEEQEIFAGDDVPIPRAAAPEAGAADPLRIITRIERQDVGVRLRVRPTLGQAGAVVLGLELEQTALAPSAAGDVARVGPTLLERRVSTTVRLAHGQTAVIAMAPRHERLRADTGVPFLRDVPWLGALFRATRDEGAQAQLVVAVRASVIRTPEEMLRESVARRVGFERQQARARAAWDLEGYAVLVATVDRPEEARALAARAAADAGREARVTAWRDGAGREHHDVLVPGFARYAVAARAANGLRAAGWRARVILLDPPPRP